jgi:heat shock protein HslJ
MRNSFVLIYCLLFLLSCQDDKLTRHNWTLKTVFDQDVSGLEKPITLNFNPEKHAIAGFAGCNQYFGTYTSNKSTVSFQGIGSTRMFCQETMATEMKFLTALEQVESFKIEDDALLLLADDKIILEFRE